MCQDIIYINDKKDIKLIGKDLIYIALETSWITGEFKRHELILKVAILDSESYLFHVTLSNLHLMIPVNNMQLGKTLGKAKIIMSFAD